MDLRLGIAPVDGNLLGDVIKVLVGNDNDIKYSAKTIAELVQKVKAEKDHIQVTRLKEGDEFVIIKTDPESTKTVSGKNKREAVYVFRGNSNDLRDFWLEYLKLDQEDSPK